MFHLTLSFQWMLYVSTEYFKGKMRFKLYKVVIINLYELF